MSDLLSILRGNIKYPFGIPGKIRNKISTYNVNNYINSLYLRFEVKDKPGVLSEITKKLAKNKISVKRIIQTPSNKNKMRRDLLECLKEKSNKQNFLRNLNHLVTHI